jgi:UDP-glucose:(heptosyl)LPS alpha-1,3-glucosyltransferase
MKIALSFPGCHRRGGVERIIYECARFLAGRGHDVTVFASEFENTPEPFKYRQVAVPRTFKTLQTTVFYAASKQAMRGAEFDAHGSFGCVCPEGGVYWAQSVHAAWIDKARALRPWWSIARWKQWLNPVHKVLLRYERSHFRKGASRRIIALTDEVKADLQHYYGVAPGDIDVIPNGFAPDEFNLARARELRAPVRAELGFTPGQKVIVFVGNELDRKGYPALLAAVESMADPRVRILVAGRIAPAPHRLVTYVGSSGDVARYYAAGDVFALPTLYEAWGMVIVEAMAMGIPSLTSRLAGAAVAIEEGKTGDLLDDPRNVSEIVRKLRPLLDGKHATPEEIAASVAKYAWPEILSQYEALLCENASAGAASLK